MFGKGEGKSPRKRGVFALVAFGFAIVLHLVLAPSASAATRSCDFSFTTNKYSCSGSGNVRGVHDVIGAKVFTGRDFAGDVLTLWVPAPCPKNNKVDHFVTLGNEMRNKISSVQGWSTCSVWLYRADDTREGPYDGDHPDVGSHVEDQAVIVGLS